MNWTKEKPTEPGFYVARMVLIKKYLTVYEIFALGDKLFIVTASLSGGKSLNDEFYDNLEWLGPLPE